MKKNTVTIVDGKKNYVISSLEDLFQVFKTNFFTRQKWRYCFNVLLKYAIKKNTEELKLLTDDKQRFINDYEDDSKWFKSILQKYQKQEKLLNERLQNPEIGVLWFFVKGATGGRSKINETYEMLGGVPLKIWKRNGGTAKNYHPDFHTGHHIYDYRQNLHRIDVGIFEDIDFP